VDSAAKLEEVIVDRIRIIISNIKRRKDIFGDIFYLFIYFLNLHKLTEMRNKRGKTKKENKKNH
jgi:hypothetical protein